MRFNGRNVIKPSLIEDNTIFSYLFTMLAKSRHRMAFSNSRLLFNMSSHSPLLSHKIDVQRSVKHRTRYSLSI